MQIVSHPFDDGDPLTITDRDGSNPRVIFSLKAGGHNHYPIWSPDGQWIYFISGMWDAREMDIWRIRATGGDPERMTNTNADIRYLAPIDDRTIVYTSPDQDGAAPGCGHWIWRPVARSGSAQVSKCIRRSMRVAMEGALSRRYLGRRQTSGRSHCAPSS